MDKEKAQALLDLTQMGPGKVLIEHVADELEESTRRLYYAPSDSVQAYQGQARAYYEILKLFQDAKKEITS